MCRVLCVSELCWVNMLCALVCLNGAAGGLMEMFIYSSLFEGATSVWEGYSHHRPTWCCLTPCTHTHMHIHSSPHYTVCHSSRVIPAWRPSCLEKHVCWSTHGIPLLHIQLGISLFMSHREVNLLQDQSNIDFVALSPEESCQAQFSCTMKQSEKRLKRYVMVKWMENN